MTEEQKQALVADCKASIARIEKALPHWQKSTYTLPYLESELARQKIALAALTAPPVKLPKGFNPAIGDIFDKAAPVMRRDATDGKWLHKADVTKILNELGYKVQE